MDEFPDTDQTERDDATFSMFGDEQTIEKDDGYQVLARKYRPRSFEDLIGQEAMVRTLRNAFETGRIAHAFMLTGVRGVGKTTTARLLARALNYESDEHHGPNIKLDPPGAHCKAIMESRHPDVLELDAASRTGVADMRELLDGVRYSPVSARYKVYIIDEVHMLSTASFNALLKTLEEPPPHVKFVFATTEIRKVPVTVLSRCQRFDLKRLDTGELARHLGRVARREGADVTEEGLALIARAAEGSVRDGLSILDQAIVQTLEGEAVSGAAVRDMLGLGDRARLLDAFELSVKADAKAALDEINDQIANGADPLVLLKDLLEIAADVATLQATGEDYTLPGPAEWTRRSREIAGSLSPAQTQRNWQILLSGYRDTMSAPESDTALRMVILRLVAAASLPSPEEAARMIAEGGINREGGASGGPGKPEAQAGAAGSAHGLSGFEDIVARLETRKELRLLGEVSSYLRLGELSEGRLVCDVKEGAPPDLLRRLADFLQAETGLDWQIDRATVSSETLKEAETRAREEEFASVSAHPAIAAALEALPGARIVAVESQDTLEAGPREDNVVDLHPSSKRKA